MKLTSWNRVLSPIATVALGLFPIAAVASHGGHVLSGYVNDEGEIELVIPHENSGVMLNSPSQNLVPLPVVPGSRFPDPGPYQFMLHNDQQTISWATLAVPIYIGGTFNTMVRLREGDASSVEGLYGGVTPQQFRIFDAPPPIVSATFDIGGRLLLHGESPELKRVGVVFRNPNPTFGRFRETWFDDLEGLDGSLSLPFESDIYPVSEEFDLVAVYCQEDGNCREIEFETEFLCEPTFGDVNGDGRVGFSDFLIMSFNFGKEVPDHRYGDVDCDGRVAFSDFLVTSRCFGCTTVGTQSVPEAGSGLMMFVGFVALLSYVRGTRST